MSYDIFFFLGVGVGGVDLIYMPMYFCLIFFLI